VDFLLSRSPGQLVLNPLNPLPPYTPNPIHAPLWAARGLDYPTLLDRLSGLALERHAGKQQLRTSLT
jgi:D-alanine-D-alanine ligase